MASSAVHNRQIRLLASSSPSPVSGAQGTLTKDQTEQFIQDGMLSSDHIRSYTVLAMPLKYTQPNLSLKYEREHCPQICTTVSRARCMGMCRC
jgi:hypothetical protein